MTRDHYFYAIWTTLILACATAAILYQHASHSAYIVGAVTGAGNAAGPAANPGDVGQASQISPVAAKNQPSSATGVWTPLGPNSDLFSYSPQQNW